MDHLTSFGPPRLEIHACQPHLDLPDLALPNSFPGPVAPLIVLVVVARGTYQGQLKICYRSLIWTAIFCVGVGMTVDSIAFVVHDYYSYPVITSTILSHQTSVTFPAVTVCNHNRQVRLEVESMTFSPSVNLRVASKRAQSGHLEHFLKLFCRLA